VSLDARRSEPRSSRFSVPTLAEIFWGPLANGFRKMAEWRKRGVLGEALQAHRRWAAMRFETLEPRILLSADLTHAASEGVAIDATLRVDDVGGAPILRLVDNPSTWLAFTDLVFVDPVGTGFSHGKGKDDNPDKPFWSELVVEATYRAMADPSRPERELDTPLPEDHPLQRKIAGVLRSLVERFGDAETLRGVTPPAKPDTVRKKPDTTSAARRNPVSTLELAGMLGGIAP